MQLPNIYKAAGPAQPPAHAKAGGPAAKFLAPAATQPTLNVLKGKGFDAEPSHAHSLQNQYSSSNAVKQPQEQDEQEPPVYDPLDLRGRGGPDYGYLSRPLNMKAPSAPAHLAKHPMTYPQPATQPARAYAQPAW